MTGRSITVRIHGMDCAEEAGGGLSGFGSKKPVGHRDFNRGASAFTSGTNPFAHAGSPADRARFAEYEAGPYAKLGDDLLKGFAATAPADADVADVARAIVKVVDMPFGKRRSAPRTALEMLAGVAAAGDQAHIAGLGIRDQVVGIRPQKEFTFAPGHTNSLRCLNVPVASCCMYASD